MESIFFGAIGALIVLGPFLLGVAIGMKLLSRKTQSSEPVTRPVAPDEEERRRLLEDQRAFESLLQYNTDVVYGRTDGVGGESS